ncbi:hypothetical protein AB1E18_018333 [Capra hircus]
MQRGGAGRRFIASHWRTRPFLSLRSPAPPPSTARLPGAAGVDGSRRMLIRGRPPQPIGRPRSVGEVSAESQKNRAGPTAACSASGAGRALPARQPGDPQGGLVVVEEKGWSSLNERKHAERLGTPDVQTLET